MLSRGLFTYGYGGTWTLSCLLLFFLASCSGKTPTQNAVYSDLEQGLTEEGYPSVEVVAHLDRKSYIQAVDYNLRSYLQRETERRMDSLKVTFVEEIEPFGYWIEVFVTPDGRVCGRDSATKRGECYDPVSHEFRYYGSGQGYGPEEIQNLAHFTIEPKTGKSALFDWDRNIVKVLSEQGRHLVEMQNKAVAISGIEFIDEDRLLILPSLPRIDEPELWIWELTKPKPEAFVYHTVALSDTTIKSIGYMNKSLASVDKNTFVVAYHYGGFFKLYDTSGNLLVTRSFIENRHTQPVYFTESPVTRGEFVQARYERNKEWIRSLSANRRHLVALGFVENSKAMLDFYDKKRGDYLFSHYFYRKRSTIGIAVGDSLIAHLTGDGIVEIYRYEYPEAYR